MKGRIHVVVAIVVAAYYFLTNLQMTIPVSISASLLGLLVMSSVLKYKESQKLLFKQALLLMLLFTILFFVTYNMNFELALGFITQSIFVIAPVYLLKLTINSCSHKTIKWILMLVGIILLYVICVSSVEYVRNPLISRILAAGGNSTYELNNLNAYRLKNIAGFGFCYGVVFLLLLVRPLKSNGNKVLALVLALTILGFLIFAQYTTAILLGIMCLLFSFYYKKEQKMRTVLLLLGLPVLYLVGDLLLGVFIKLIPGESVSYKLNDIRNFLYAGGFSSTTSIQGRVDLYMLSLSGLMRSPIWGNSVQSISLSEHSTVLDMMAKTGVIGGIALISMVASQFKYAVSTAHINKSLEIKVLGYALLILSVLNPTYQHIELFFVAFYLIPLAQYWLEEEEKMRMNYAK